MNPSYADVIGQRRELSKIDVLKVNRLYDCDEWGSASTRRPGIRVLTSRPLSLRFLTPSPPPSASTTTPKPPTDRPQPGLPRDSSPATPHRPTDPNPTDIPTDAPPTRPAKLSKPDDPFKTSGSGAKPRRKESSLLDRVSGARKRGVVEVRGGPRKGG